MHDWYLLVYADAYEWVELPNTHGMALFADGGVLGSKPYAASSAYIDRMSDYCGDCAYDVKQKLGTEDVPVQLPLPGFSGPQREDARQSPAPFNALPDARKPERVKEIRADAKRFLERLPATYGS